MSDNTQKRQKSEAKSVIFEGNKISSMIPPYETYTINSRKSLAGGSNFPISYKVEDGLVKPTRRMSDTAVPFNFLLNSPSANAVKRVIAFNDEKGEPCKTIVIFDNGDRVVVKRNENDAPDLRQRILWAILKHSFGTSIERQLDKILKSVTVTSEELSKRTKTLKEAKRNKAIGAKSVRIDG